MGDDSKISFDHTSSPEFVDWEWVDYWHPLNKVISFKRSVYKKALVELEPLVLSAKQPNTDEG